MKKSYIEYEAPLITFTTSVAGACFCGSITDVNNERYETGSDIIIF